MDKNEIEQIREFIINSVRQYGKPMDITVTNPDDNTTIGIRINLDGKMELLGTEQLSEE